MWSHKGKEARETLLKLKENIKQYVLNHSKPSINKEYISDDFKLIQELKNDGMKVMLIKTLYSLGRTYFYIRDNKEEAKKVLESIPRLAKIVKIEDNKNLQDLFEVHLSKANALGIIIREEAEYYMSKGVIKYAMQKINEVLQLYEVCITDNTTYKLDYDHNGQYFRTIVPSKNAYALAECYEQRAKCYLDFAKIDESYLIKGLEGIIGTQDALFGGNIKLSGIPNKKAASILNTLSSILLASSDNINFKDFKDIKHQILKWLNHYNFKQELQEGVEHTSSMLALIKAITYIAKDKSREFDHTRADACKIIIEVLNNQIKDEENKVSSKELDQLNKELQENQQEIDKINNDLNREHYNILQTIKLDEQCQDIESVLKSNSYKNDILSSETMAQNVGEELEYNTNYNHRKQCIEEILKLESAQQIPVNLLGYALKNSALKGYANYVSSIISHEDIYSRIEKNDKDMAISLAANNLEACVKFCFEENHQCNYIKPISGFYQWSSYLKGQCITIQSSTNTDIEGPAHYSEVVTLLANDLFQHMHDEL